MTGLTIYTEAEQQPQATMTTTTTLLTSGLGSDDAVRTMLANVPDGTSLRYPKGTTAELYQATKTNGHVTITPVAHGHRGNNTREVVTDEAVLRIVESVGVWIKSGYTHIVLCILSWLLPYFFSTPPAADRMQNAENTQRYFSKHEYNFIRAAGGRPDAECRKYTTILFKTIYDSKLFAPPAGRF